VVAHSHLQQGDLLTAVQALQLLPVGRSTLYRLIKEGRIPAVRVKSGGSRRGRLLILRRDLEDYVASLRGEQHPPPALIDVDELLDRVRGRP